MSSNRAPRDLRRIQRRLGGDFYDFDLDQVELAAFRETLQTTLGANPFSAFISGFLVPYSGSLIWLGEGPGVGREMRRAFSALFGRFFARAYLSDCHNLVWFAPLNGPDHVVRERLRVRSRGSRQDFPDWICASRAHLALAEAKGARSGSRLTSYSHPAPIKQAIKQLQNCRVSTFRRGTGNWVDRKVKGVLEVLQVEVLVGHEREQAARRSIPGAVSFASSSRSANTRYSLHMLRSRRMSVRVLRTTMLTGTARCR